MKGIIKQNLILFFKSINLVFSVSRIQTALLLAVIIFQGILPITAASLSASILDNVININLYRQDLLKLCVLWGVVLFAYDLVAPIILFLQSNIADKTLSKVNRSIISKSISIKGLELYERPDFQNDIEILISQSYHRPTNLVVTIVGLSKDIVIIFSCLIVLFQYISWIVFIPLLGVILHSTIMTRVNAAMWQESLGRSTKSRFMNYISSLNINTGFVKELKLFPIGKVLLEKYTDIFTTIYRSMFKLRLKQLYLPILPILIYILANIYSVYFISNQVINGVLGVGGIALLIQSLSFLHQSVSGFGEQSGWLSGHLLFFKKYFEFINRKEPISEKNVKKELKHVSIPLSITFKNVYFSYPGTNTEILKNISFNVNKGEKLAIVGANGSGKTTLIKLLCGFYRPTKGTILINNKPIQKYYIEQLRKYITPVFQDFGCYNLTIEENILMGNEFDLEKLTMCMNQAGCDFVDHLNKKQKAQLGRAFGGIDLSGGQWQKLAIARALYKGGGLFILDEPTSSLDPISENKIFYEFAKVAKEKSTIFVTHRLTAISVVDRVLLLDKGNIAGIGTHNFLMQSVPLYRKMFEAQLSRINYLSKSYSR